MVLPLQTRLPPRNPLELRVRRRQRLQPRQNAATLRRHFLSPEHRQPCRASRGKALFLRLRQIIIIPRPCTSCAAHRPRWFDVPPQRTRSSLPQTQLALSTGQRRLRGRRRRRLAAFLPPTLPRTLRFLHLGVDHRPMRWSAMVPAGITWSLPILGQRCGTTT